MRILHYHPDNPQGMTDKYVATLCDSMDGEYQNEHTQEAAEAKDRLTNGHYDILHLHGCWHNSFRSAARIARSKGTRLVVTPHGQLEPWVISENYWREKLPKKLIYQRQLIRQAYAVVVQGRMEEECLHNLGWNSRTVIIKNCLVTQAISPDDMARQTAQLYRMVMDSNTLELMTGDTRHTLRQLLKAGITGDSRWLREQCVTITDAEQWRMVYCWAEQEHVGHIVRKGISILKLQAPDIDVSQAPCFLPDGYEPPTSIGQAIGLDFSSENQRLVATFRQLSRLARHRQLAISHLAELDKELREHDCAEDRLCERLQDKHLLRFAARLMQVAHDLTGLDEGFMPMQPLNDRTTRKIRAQIDNRLKK